MQKKSQVIKFIEALKLLIKHKKLDDMPIDYSLQILKKFKDVMPNLKDDHVISYLSMDPRSIYIWSKINFLEQQAMLLMYHKEFIDSIHEIEGDIDDVNTSNILFTINDSLALATRKTLETLLELKGFVKYDDVNLFRTYYCCAEIENKDRDQQDRNSFFNANSKNLQRQIEFCKHDLEGYLDKVPEKSIFFISNKDDPKFVNVPELLKRVFPLLTEAELLIAGYSYQVYSKLSTRLHARILPKEEQIIGHDLKVMYTHLGLLLLHVITVLGELVPEVESNQLEQIKRLLKNNEISKKLHHKYTNSDIKIDDYVIAIGQIARVIKVNKSSFGYKSYKVRFIEEPSVVADIEDTFKPSEIRFWADGQKIKKDAISIIGKEYVKGKANKELIDKCLDSGVLKLLDALRKVKKVKGN